jgi:protein SCO1/2
MELSRTLARRWWAVVASVGIASAAAHDLTGPHADHRHAATASVRTTANYVIPDVQLVRDDGKSVNLAQELNDGRPVVLNFIYTTCTSICPLSSQTFADLQATLGSERDKVHLVSVSIDPEQDTPARLREYASRYDAGHEWQHYTGTVSASVATQRAFNVYRGDKMDHPPVTLVRPTPTSRWVRIEGFATAEQLLRELTDVVAAR